MIYDVVDRETISPVSSSVGFTAAKLAVFGSSKGVYACIQAINGDVRFTIDGSIPSTSLGLKLTTNSSIEIWGTDAMSNFRCIDDGGTAKLEVVYMRAGA